MQTLSAATIINTEPLIFNNFAHNAGAIAIAILPGEPLYNKLLFSTPDPNIQISISEFITKCINI